MSVITSFQEITPDWLTGVLQGVDSSIGRVTAIELDTGETTFCLKAYLRPTYAERPGPSGLFMKFSKDHHPVTTPEEGREVVFYQHIAPATRVPSLVHCYDACYDPDRHRLHLVLEDVSETHHAEAASQLPLTGEHAGMVVDALAQIHAAWWEHPPFEISRQPWPNAEEIAQRIGRVRAQVNEFVAMLGDRLTAASQELLQRVLASLPRLYVRLLDAQGYTVVHDDIHVGNVMYPSTSAVGSIRLIDWQTWHVDLAAKDLAHMMAVFWYPDRRRTLELPLLNRYHGQLLAAGVAGYSWDQFWWDYRLCVLRKLFLPPHQWATGHTPSIWWNHLQRIMLAFDDLGCEELLDG